MLGFREVWAHDFEFVPDDRNGTRRTLRVWEDELRAMPAAPFSTGPDAVAVAHNASAEIACFDELGWQHPSNVLDTVAIHRVYTNGAIGDYGLLAALTAWGLEGIAPEEKHEMRDLILSGGPWSPEQREAILAYCESDVVALDHLLRAMEPGITAEPERLPQELLRGEYMRAVAHIERIGIPFDAERLTQIRENREDIARHLIEKVDCDFGVYDGLRFDSRRFKAFLLHHEIAWPTYPSGMPMLDASIFKDMCRINPMLEPLRQLRKSVATLKAMKLDAGDDGRSRYPVMPFASKTGRNQPKAARFVFGQPKWLRSLIMPAEGRALAYIDYSSQEVAIAAALAGDELLWEDYASGDPYIAFAVRAGLIQPGDSPERRAAVRKQAKTVVLGVQYGQEAEGMASRAGMTVPMAREMLQRHKRRYKAFWRRYEEAAAAGVNGIPITLVLGWRIRQGPWLGVEDERPPNPRSFANFPIQGTGSEILRAATVSLRRAGFDIPALIHDATLTEHDQAHVEERAALVAEIMGAASEAVLGRGRRIRSDIEIIPEGERYRDKDGAAMWGIVCDFLGVEP